MTGRRLPAALVAGLIVAAVLAVYWPARHFSYVDFDDYLTVVWNPLLQRGLTGDAVCRAFTGFQGDFWIPLTWISYMMDIALFGMAPGGFHLTNIVLHTLGTLLFFLTLRSLTGALWRSAAAAALLAVHPLHVESVAWISERKDVLAAALGFASLAAYVGWVRQRTHLRYELAVALYAASLLAKPSLVGLPLLLLVLDWWPLGRQRGAWATILLEKLPFSLLAAASAVLTLLARGGLAAASTGSASPPGDRLANAAGAALFYLRKMIVPAGLATPYPPDSPLLGATAAAATGLLLAAATALALARARRAPFALAGWIWYLACLLPVAGLVPTGRQLVADRFAYFTLPGIYLIAAWATAAATRGRHWSRIVAVALFLGLLMALSAGARRQLGFWRSGETLSRRALAVTRNNWFALTNLGTTLLEAGDPAQALRYYNQALAVRPDEGTAHANAGLALARLGRHAEAVTALEKAWALGFREAPAEVARGRSLLALGMAAESATAFRRALTLDPGNVEAREGIGIAGSASGGSP
jgi:tetratricopeptide (TPR) repeat protein